MIGSLPSGATAFLVAKNETKNYISCLKADVDVQGVKVPEMIGSFAISSTSSLLAKNETKNHISHFKPDFDVQGV